MTVAAATPCPLCALSFPGRVTLAAHLVHGHAPLRLEALRILAADPSYDEQLRLVNRPLEAPAPPPGPLPHPAPPDAS